jgi:hypothetical protein
MQANAVLEDLGSRGATFHVEGPDLRVTPPPGGLTAADRAALKAYKPALLALLSDRAPAGVQDTAAPPAPLDVPVLIHSRLLGEPVRIVEALDGPPPPPGKGAPVTYSRAEIEAMRGLSPDAKRAIHTSKRWFGGIYTGPVEVLTEGIAP